MADYKYDEFKINEIDIDFIERMLKSLPSNIYFKDREGRYVFCTHYWNHIRTDKEDPTWSIRGKFDLDIRKDKENAAKAMEEDRRIFATQNGTCYEIMEQVDGKEEYLQVIKNPVYDANGTMIGIVGLINNITGMKVLEKKLEQMATTDILTGLRNRTYLSLWIEKYKEKDIFPLAVIMADCNGLKRVNDRFGHLAGDQYIIETAKALTNCTPKHGCVMRMGGDEFLVLIPKCDEAQAGVYLQQVRESLQNKQIEGLSLSVAMGASICREREFRIEDYIAKADREMYEEKSRYKT